jgi:transcriptional regulator with XRE-family HTH domain
MISLGAQIRAGRALAGWSQADLAKAARISVSAVRYWEEQHSRIIAPVSGTGFGPEQIEIALREAGVKLIDDPAPGVVINPERFKFWVKPPIYERWDPKRIPRW